MSLDVTRWRARVEPASFCSSSRTQVID